ncbi:MAG: adenylate/guanylate cyclase domain-containing protein [Gemmatimonadota bacterium]
MRGSTTRQIMAVMFTDVVGYTALMQDDEGAAREVRARHRSILETAVTGHDGDLLQTFGDGSLSVFPSAVNAVRAAIKIQQDAQIEAPPLPLRIGVHQGEISFDSQGAFGDSVNIAARIETLGTAGSVLISAKVHDDVKNQPAMQTAYLGMFALKNVQNPVGVYAVLAPGLSVPTPERMRGARGGELLNSPSLPATSSARHPGATRLRRALLGVGVVATAAFVGHFLPGGHHADPDRGLARFEVTPSTESSLLPNVVGVDVALSPDGRQLVWVGAAPGGTQLWRRSLDDLAPKAIPDTRDARDPVFSPDGTSIAFREGERLRTMRLNGGGPVTLVERGLSGGADWGADGFVYFPGAEVLYRVPSRGGAPEPVTTPGDGVHRFPQALPDGEGVLFTLERPGTPERSTLMLAVGGEDSVRTLLTGTRGRLLPSGHLLYSGADGALRATRFDRRRRRVVDPPVVIIDAETLRGGAATKFAIADDGSLLYRTGLIDRVALQFFWVDRDGRSTPVESRWTFDPDSENRGWDLSPDDRGIVFKAVTDLGADIWIKTLGGGPPARFTYDAGEERMPRFSPDGGSVLYLTDRDGNLDVWSRPADGTGTAVPLVDMEQSIAEAVWSPDGRWLVLRTAGAAGIIGNRDLFAIRPGVDSVPRALFPSAADEAAPAVSPNGRWLAYHSDETGRREVFVRPFPNVEGGKFQISEGGGRAALWSRDGRTLYYIADEGGTTVGVRRLIEAQVSPGPPFSVLERRTLFDVEDAFYFANNSNSYRVSSDDARFLMARYSGEGARVEMVLVQGFGDELRRLWDG